MICGGGESEGMDAGQRGGRTRVAILGGGMAGLTAAFELTKTPELREAYDVTIYQMGWRLGGKCATGRGPNGRIQEHGIHGFSGSYYNAFALMHACYAELPAATCVDGVQSVGVLKSFKDAFHGVDKVNLWEVRNRRLISWPFYIAPNKMDPGDYDSSIALIGELVRRLRALFSVDFSTMPGQDPGGSRARLGVRAWLGEALGLVRVMYRSGLLLSMIRTSCSWVNIFQGLGSVWLQVQRIALTADFLLALRRGWKTDQVCSRGFDSIDDLDYRAWLARHKASQRTLDCSVSYNTIDLAYSYPGGDTTRAPEMGAGTYLHWTLRMLLNMGSLLWTFAAGTGETLIAPLYHVLKSRGVSFKFFHKVTALRLTNDGARIAGIEFDEQARLKTPTVEYDPLVRCGELLCWPAEPKYELIADGDILKTFDGGRPVDLESYWSPWNAAAADRAKKLVAGEDFDKVVFAISIEAVRHLCRDILERDTDGRWRTMVDAVRTCPTQTMQIWLEESPVR